MKNTWEINRKEEGIPGRGNRMHWDMKTKEDMVYWRKWKQPPYVLWYTGGTQRKDKSRKQLGCYLRNDGASQTLLSPLSKTLYKVPVIYPCWLTHWAQLSMTEFKSLTCLKQHLNEIMELTLAPISGILGQAGWCVDRLAFLEASSRSHIDSSWSKVDLLFPFRMKEECQKSQQWTFPFKQLSNPRGLPWVTGRTQFSGTLILLILTLLILIIITALNQGVFYVSQALG